MSILSEITVKANYNEALTKYDSEIKINKLTFMIADDIDAICKVINSKSENNGTYENVIKYIDDCFRDMNFGIPYVEEKRLELVKDLMLNSHNEVKNIAKNVDFKIMIPFISFSKNIQAYRRQNGRV